MPTTLGRRDFLKLANYAPLGMYASRFLKGLNFQLPTERKNIIIVVLDALSAHNMSLYGYARETTPNINRLLHRAVVYHNHIAGSNFTTSGTASLLTGTFPWTHRALQSNGRVIDPYPDRSIFSLFRDYYRIAYSHNEWVNTLLEQFQKDIEEWIPREQLYLFSSDSVVQKVFQNDKDISSVAWVRNTKIRDQGYSYSLYLSHLLSFLEKRQVAEYHSRFPLGLPTAHADNGFLLEYAVDELLTRLHSIPQPFLGYFHFLPPHHPYRPPIEYLDKFRGDNYRAIEKEHDVFATKQSDPVGSTRKLYDEFLLYADHEFGRLVDALENSNALDNTWLVLTSDHGESFERGIIGHITEALYQPLIHVPLVIFEPGRTDRLDVHARTSVVDVIPTLAHLTGKNTPEWMHGSILPPYKDNVEERAMYAVRSYPENINSPLKEASVTLLKGRYKLHYYFGYPKLRGKELIRLYDIEKDPEELVDLKDVMPQVTKAFLDELKSDLAKEDAPYRK